MITDNDKNILKLLQLSAIRGETFCFAETSIHGIPCVCLGTFEPVDGDINPTLTPIAIIMNDALYEGLGEIEQLTFLNE